MQELIHVAIGGAAGTLLRHSICLLSQRLGMDAARWPTLGVNTLGCFLFGIILAIDTPLIDERGRLILLTGFMGGLTTFSSLISNTTSLLQGNRWQNALTHLGVELVVGVLALYLGMLHSEAF